MARKSFKVKKGIETEPLIWGLSIPLWTMYVTVFVVLIVVGSMTLFGALQKESDKWYVGLLILLIGCPILLVVKVVLESVLKPKKHKFGKQEVYLNQNDLIKNL